MCVFNYLSIYVCVSRLLDKWKTIQTWNLALILPLTSSKNGVFFKKSPWRPLALKNCCVTWIFRIPPRLPCFLKFHFIQWNHWSLHSVFYKNVEDRFWEKIKNFCNITSSPKVLKWQKCDIRTSYVTLEKLKTFPQLIYKFSKVKTKFLPKNSSFPH